MSKSQQKFNYVWQVTLKTPFPQTLSFNIFNRYLEDLKVSGYTEKDRYEILKGGLNTYKKLKEKVSAGKRPFYRHRSFDKEKRKLA